MTRVLMWNGSLPEDEEADQQDEATREQRRASSVLGMSLDTFDAPAREAAAMWKRRKAWPESDALLWIGGGSDDEMERLAAYRAHFWQSQHHGSEAACRIIVSEWLGSADFQLAQRRLQNAWEGGLVERDSAGALHGPSIMGLWPRDGGQTAEKAQPKEVNDKALKPWVRAMLDKGHTGRELGEQRKIAFPDHKPPARARVDKIYLAMFEDDFGEKPRAGSLHPKLMERRRANGLA